MKRFALAAARRLVVSLLIVWGVTTASWFLTALLPGDPVQVVLGPNASPADVDRARALWGFDEPLPKRYVRFMARVVHTSAEPAGEASTEHATCASLGAGLHVDLGKSHIYNQPVTALIHKKLPASLRLALAAMVVQIAIGVGLGILAGMRAGSRIDEVLVAASAALSAAPTFVLGLVLQYLLAHRLGWVPLDGLGLTPEDEARALVLPALTLGIYGAAVLTRFVRAELASALAEPFVRTARAKGASVTRAAIVHALRTSLGPIAQLTVLELGALIGGAIVTERLFRWPGLGDMSVAAIQNRDAQALVGVTLVASVAMVAATAIADLVSIALDPRQR